MTTFSSNFYGGRIGDAIASFLNENVRHGREIVLGYGKAKVTIKREETHEQSTNGVVETPNDN